MEKEIKIKKFDIIGIVSSGLCLVHCLITPLLLTTQSLLLKFSENWEYLDYVFVIMSFVAVYFAANHTHSKSIAILLWIFFTLFLFSMIFQHDFDWLIYIAYGSSMALAITHIINIRHCSKKCR